MKLFTTPYRTRARPAAEDYERIHTEPLDTHICCACGRLSEPQKGYDGKLAWEASLWAAALAFLYVIPYLGVALMATAYVYSLWRGVHPYKSCRECGTKRTVIPLASRKGLHLFTRIFNTPSDENRWSQN